MVDLLHQKRQSQLRTMRRVSPPVLDMNMHCSDNCVHFPELQENDVPWPIIPSPLNATDNGSDDESVVVKSVITPTTSKPPPSANKTRSRRKRTRVTMPDPRRPSKRRPAELDSTVKSNQGVRENVSSRNSPSGSAQKSATSGARRKKALKRKAREDGE